MQVKIFILHLSAQDKLLAFDKGEDFSGQSPVLMAACTEKQKPNHQYALFEIENALFLSLFVLFGFCFSFPVTRFVLMCLIYDVFDVCLRKLSDAYSSQDLDQSKRFHLPTLLFVQKWL